jgi:hypothetical protein
MAFNFADSELYKSANESLWGSIARSEINFKLEVEEMRAARRKSAEDCGPVADMSDAARLAAMRKMACVTRVCCVRGRVHVRGSVRARAHVHACMPHMRARS